MAIAPPPGNLAGRTLIYDGLAQNDIDMANHRLLNLDFTGFPPSGIPPTIHPPANQWLHDWDAATQEWSVRQPDFIDIHGFLTSGQFGQQRAITELGTIAVGVWNGTPLASQYVPRLNLITPPTDNVSMGGHRLVSVANPIDPGDAVNKGFMDFLLQGLQPKEAVRAASTREIGLTGIQTVDGVDLQVGDRVLVKNQAVGSRDYQNGIYTVATGSTGHWERAADADSSPELERAYCTVMEGTTNAGTSWVQPNELAHDPPISGDIVHFILFSSSGGGGSAVIAGTGLTKDGDTLNVRGTTDRIAVGADSVDIDPGYIGQPSITTLGIITEGTWYGDVIDGAHGGTGTQNTGRTISLCGNLSTEHALGIAFTANLTLRLSENTNVLMPTAGVIATTNGIETFSNKRITRRVAKIASNAQPAINSDALDVFCITNLVEPITSMSSNLTGTPTDRQQLEIWVKQSSGAAPPQTVAWGAAWMGSVDLPLPTAFESGIWIFMSFVYVTEFSKWLLTGKVNKFS